MLFIIVTERPPFLWHILVFGTLNRRPPQEIPFQTHASSRGWTFVRRSRMQTKSISITQWSFHPKARARSQLVGSQQRWTSLMAQLGAQKRTFTQTWFALSTATNSISQSLSTNYTWDTQASKYLRRSSFTTRNPSERLLSMSKQLTIKSSWESDWL